VSLGLRGPSSHDMSRGSIPYAMHLRPGVQAHAVRRPDGAGCERTSLGSPGGGCPPWRRTDQVGPGKVGRPSPPVGRPSLVDLGAVVPSRCGVGGNGGGCRVRRPRPAPLHRRRIGEAGKPTFRIPVCGRLTVGPAADGRRLHSSQPREEGGHPVWLRSEVGGGRRQLSEGERRKRGGGMAAGGSRQRVGTRL